ncbi:MAG: ferredoxin [Sporichthyaceae bacterium]
MRIVRNTRCRGSGMCEFEAPEYFEIQNDGTMLILDEHPSDDRLDYVRKAMKVCPMAALSLVDD